MPRNTRLGRAALDLLRDELAACPRGHKTACIEKAARLYGMHPATLRKLLLKAGILQPSAARRRKLNADYEAWTQVLAQLSSKAPGSPIPLDQCLTAAVADGLLPLAAAEVPVGTYYRIIRTLGLCTTTRRHYRLHAEYGYQAVQLDASTSQHWTVQRKLDDGDVMLRLHHAPFSASGYKNKPLGPDRLRCVVYATWDMHSGHQLARYVAAPGESGVDAMDYLCWAMAPREDPRFPIHGMIANLWSDQGPLVKKMAATDLLDRLGIAINKGRPYQKTRMGGVEQTHATRWRSFERQFFLYALAGERVELRLSELNRQLMTYLAKLNERCSRTDHAVSKTQAWVRSVNARGGLPALPQDPMDTLSLEINRVLDAAGILRWNNKEYEVKEIFGRPVVARRDKDGQRVVVYDPATKETYDAIPYVPRLYDEIRTGKTPTGETTKEQGDALRLEGKTLYGDDPAGNVAQFPARKQPAAPLQDPLDTSRYRNLTAALMAFNTIYAVPMEEATRALVAQQITDAGLSKDFVRELAQDMRAFLQQHKQNQQHPGRPSGDLTLVI